MRIVLYALVTGIAAVVTYGLAILIWKLSTKYRLYPKIRERDVHTRPTPRLGGVAMFLGMVVAFGVSVFIGIAAAAGREAEGKQEGQQEMAQAHGVVSLGARSASTKGSAVRRWISIRARWKSRAAEMRSRRADSSSDCSCAHSR